MASEPATFQNQVDTVVKKIAELAKTEGCASKVEKVSKCFRRHIVPVIFKNLIDMLEDDGLNITQRTNNPAESMNAKVKKHVQSGQQVDRMIQELK